MMRYKDVQTQLSVSLVLYYLTLRQMSAKRDLGWSFGTGMTNTVAQSSHLPMFLLEAPSGILSHLEESNANEIVMQLEQGRAKIF